MVCCANPCMMFIFTILILKSVGEAFTCYEPLGWIGLAVLAYWYQLILRYVAISFVIRGHSSMSRLNKCLVVLRSALVFFDIIATGLCSIWGSIIISSEEALTCAEEVFFLKSYRNVIKANVILMYILFVVSILIGLCLCCAIAASSRIITETTEV